MFQELIKILPEILILFTPLAVLLAGVVRGRSLDTPARRAALWMVALGLLFCLLDFALLSALPRLGLSFGPIQVPLVVLVVLRFLLLLVWMFQPQTRIPARAGRVVLALFQGLLTAALLYSFYYEPFDLKVTQLELKTADLQPGGRLRIVQLSDIHIERITRREHKVAAAIQSLQPDLIVLTGDYLNNSFFDDPQAVQDLRWLVSQLHASTGIYAINGSTEKPARTREFFSGLPVTVLDNQSLLVATPAGEVEIVGISDLVYSADARALIQVAGPVPADRFSLLLYHKPDLAETAAGMGMDLYLAGHTHGGQICLPFYGAVITFSAYGKRFEQGRFELGGTTLYVSRGLGMEGKYAPRARFLAPPEIVVVDVVGE